MKIPKITIDSGVDLKRLKKLENLSLLKIEKVSIENKMKKVKKERSTVGILGVATLPFRLGPYDVYDQILKIIGGENYKDAMILETHINSGNDYFVTNNPKDFIYNGIREKLKVQFQELKILTVDELEEIINK